MLRYYNYKKQHLTLGRNSRTFRQSLWANEIKNHLWIQNDFNLIVLCLQNLLIFLKGRGFDQETFSEKDEAAICSFNTKCRGDFRRDACWDVNHPNMNQPRTNGGAVLLGTVRLLVIASSDANRIYRRKADRGFSFNLNDSLLIENLISAFNCVLFSY